MQRVKPKVKSKKIILFLLFHLQTFSISRRESTNDKS